MTQSSRLSPAATHAIQRIEACIARLSSIPQAAPECDELRDAVRRLRQALPPPPKFGLAEAPVKPLLTRDW